MHSEIASAVVVPGWNARGRRRALGLVLLASGVVAPLLLVAYVVLTGRSRVALSLDSGFLAVVVGVGALAMVSRLVALGEVWFTAGRPTRLARSEWAVASLAVVAMLVGSVAVVEVQRARASIAPAFTPADEALYDRVEPATDASGADVVDVAPPTSPGPPPTIDVAVDVTDADISVDASAVEVVAPQRSTTTTTTSPPSPPSPPDSGVSAEQLADVTTVLLIGGDSGPGRTGLRTDAMMLFSLHAPSGRASLVSVPRDLRRALFPPGSALERRHPYGYDKMLNAVYITASSNESLRSSYVVEGVRPGVVALAQTIGYSLDVKIDDYVLVDMQGFADLIDALGGVTLRLTKEIPMPGNVPGARSQYPESIGPGVVAMDGATALGYARSRYGDNDYYRARRQRDLLAELARQVSVTDVALSFGEVADAVGGTLRTSLTPDELAETLAVIGGETAIVESVGLVPPLVNVRRPDLDAMAKIVGAVQVALVTGVPSGY